MSKLIVAESFFNSAGIMGIVDNGTNLPVALWAHWQYGPPVGERVDPVGDSVVTIEAFVNHGRWMARCPDLNCNSGQVVSETDKRFYCATCENSAVGNQTIVVTWPDDQDAIEDILIQRPEIFRNWKVGETTDDLLQENINNGVDS